MAILRIDGKTYIVPSDSHEELCRIAMELASRCRFKTWYIRVHPAAILELVTKAKAGAHVSDALIKFLAERGLKRSLTRIITPTLTLLGLAEQGRFTDVAEMLGSAIKEGSDVTGMIKAIIEENCILREILHRVSNGEDIKGATRNVLRLHGKARSDEINYTAKLIEMAVGKRGDVDLNNVIRDMITKLGMPIPGNIRVAMAGNVAYIMSGERTIGIVAIGEPVVGDSRLVKERLKALDDVLRNVEDMYQIKIKLQPAVIGGEKIVLVEAYVDGGEKVTKLIKR